MIHKNPTLSQVARGLQADLFFVPSEIIRHPSDPLKSIGVVSLDYAMTYDLERDFPQDFIYHRTRAKRAKLLSRFPEASSSINARFTDRIVLLIEDCLEMTLSIEETV